MADEFDDAIKANAEGPAEVEIDGQRVKQHRPTDLIEADRYLQTKQAIKKKGLGVKFTRAIPPGSV